ncbi:MAG: formate dehydrogenase accessory protein FdhE [Deltaproteobacteria bacterium]|nr:formate dehydrogenase accessory protein FdhE [Deltaproteobacteria bacterium]
MTPNRMPDESGQQGVGSFPAVILPDPGRIFRDRSQRFAALAKGHPLAEWLSFLGRLTRAQHELLQHYPTLPLPDETVMALAWENRTPPLADPSWRRDPAWQQALFALACDLLPHAPPVVRDTLERLQRLDGPALEALADRVLRAELAGPDADLLPFVGAALQVHWTALAARLDPMKIALPGAAPGVCPCCDFLPVAGLVRRGGEVAGLRYLHCALCNTEWHLVRVTCAACRDSNRIAYRYVEGSDGVVRAETCDACRSYLKMVYREKSPQADPVADDLSTLALDLMMADAGYSRMGPNLLFVPGG